jgi:transcriptional/translational regulatory protein YebC/TACO1
MTEAYDDQSICGEGYGPGGVAVIVTARQPSDALASAVRCGFAAAGGASGARGSVAYLFHLVGVLAFAPGTPVARTRSLAFEAGAEDVCSAATGGLEVITDPAELQQVRTRLARHGCHASSAGLTQRAALAQRLDAQQRDELQRLLEALRAIDGVTNVYSNAEIPALLA